MSLITIRELTGKTFQSVKELVLRNGPLEPPLEGVAVRKLLKPRDPHKV